MWHYNDDDDRLVRTTNLDSAATAEVIEANFAAVVKNMTALFRDLCKKHGAAENPAAFTFQPKDMLLTLYEGKYNFIEDFPKELGVGDFDEFLVEMKRRTKDVIRFNSDNTAVIVTEAFIRKLNAIIDAGARTGRFTNLSQPIFTIDFVCPGYRIPAQADLYEDSRGYFDVTVNWISHPHSLYLGVLETFDWDYAEMMRRFESFYVQNFADESLMITSVTPDLLNMYVAALWVTDADGVNPKRAAPNGWYRAKVVDIVDHERVKIHFVDFGNHDVVHVQVLRFLRMDFAKVPTQAVKASLYGIRPYQKSKHWGGKPRRFLEMHYRQMYLRFGTRFGYVAQKIIAEPAYKKRNPEDDRLQIVLWETFTDRRGRALQEMMIDMRLVSPDCKVANRDGGLPWDPRYDVVHHGEIHRFNGAKIDQRIKDQLARDSSKETINRDHFSNHSASDNREEGREDEESEEIHKANAKYLQHCMRKVTAWISTNQENGNWDDNAR